MIGALRTIAFAPLLTGCGLIAGLRTDYELSDAALDGREAGEASADAGADAPTCMDRIKNGAETDVDCGGPECSRCADGKMCSSDNDCQSGNCGAAGKCRQ